ncbi:MarR family transcriptional regulator [Streptodolium elevatio]|uniref:Helix-turn-helix domain-containing protein n=1 Tax=Streptodolium elevatio TaxID=3157996 RepID=A0ABV3DNJ5_9ACTN
MADTGFGSRSSWTFLTHHARVLRTVAAEPEIRVREIAARCELTDRAVQSILGDLERAGYLTRTRTGRRTTYEVTPGTRLRHPRDSAGSVADLLALPDTPARGPAGGPPEESDASAHP